MAVTEYEHEPVRGLPGHLPPGERILWQGSPDARHFARSALFSRWIGLYFALLALLALTTGNLGTGLLTVAGGALVIGLLRLYAAGVARTTVYTITDRRVVLRIGVALNICINLPLALIGSAGIRPLGEGTGDIALQVTAGHRLGYAVLWPHARPWRLRDPQPMLRAVPDAEEAARILRRACAAIAPNAAGESAPQAGQAAIGTGREATA